MGSLDISLFSSLYLDTNIYIYFFEDHPLFGQKAQDILTEVIDSNIQLFGSEILLIELLTLPFKEKNARLIDLYTSLPLSFPTFSSAPLTREIAILSAKLRAKYQLRTPDAIHIATAIDSQADCFVCADKKLRKVKEMKVLCL